MSAYEAVMGTEIAVTIGITIIFMGACAFLTGQALAATWRPAWHVIPYAILLGCGDRFLVYALFEGDLFLPTGYLIDAVWLFIVLSFAYRVTRVRQMATQYPWLYERVGLMGWRPRQ